ncbi:uncharacterized protein [Miscanthus floridulus]|uniref:uncharacterized protein isoform X1 n=1 Tax=Miscanthus floridulus TaxID=154761 RepID=UPI003458F91F
MDVFNGVRFVRLRCCARRGKYLAADADGSSVCLTGQHGVHNAVWAVNHAAGPDGGPCVLLRGAYGRYLLATSVQAGTGPSHGVVTAQDGLGGAPPLPGMLWQAIPRWTTFVIRSSTGRYLRANGRYLRWRRAVTSAGDNGSTMMQWDIENVPIRMTRPCILDPTYQLRTYGSLPVLLNRKMIVCAMRCDEQLTHARRQPLTDSEVARQIRYVRGETDGSVNEGAWRSMQLNTHNLMQLRLTLVDLPIGNDRIDIVILNHGTPADNDLRYPDLHAPRVLDSSNVSDK